MFLKASGDSWRLLRAFSGLLNASEVDWKLAGGRLEAGWKAGRREAGCRLEAGWRQAGGRLEAGRRQAGGRLEAAQRAGWGQDSRLLAGMTPGSEME